MSRAQTSSRIPDVDPKSAVGAALTTAIQTKLRTYLGADYVDRSLAQVGVPRQSCSLALFPCIVPQPGVPALSLLLC